MSSEGKGEGEEVGAAEKGLMTSYEVGGEGTFPVGDEKEGGWDEIPG